MPDFRPLRDSELYRVIHGWEDEHPEPPAPEPREDSLRAALAADRLHQDWRTPWWRRTEWRQVIVAAAVGVVLAVLFTAVFVAAGA